MAPFLIEVNIAMRDQLREPGVIIDGDSLYLQAKAAKRQIHTALAANDLIGARAAAAAYGGVVKRWRIWLIEALTSAVLSDVATSRAAVRDWQMSVFGKSIASARLRQYALPAHSGGGRVPKLAVPEDVEASARAFYEAHLDAIKHI